MRHSGKIVAAVVVLAIAAAIWIADGYKVRPATVQPDTVAPDEPTPLSIEAFEEYQSLLKKSRDQQRQILSLEMDLAESKTKVESLTVQLAEKARQRPEALPVATPACAEVPRFSPAVPSVVPVYERRFRLFRGRR